MSVQQQLLPIYSQLDFQETSPSSIYQFVQNTNRKYRNPPVYFSIKLIKIDNDKNKRICYPGSIFEGIVNLKVDTPLAAQCLILVFKAAEHIQIDNSFESKPSKEQLFVIRTVLWGLPSHTGDKWPIFETGVYQFPFICKMPMVNYPPSFKHHLASCEFELVASLIRPGIRPFQTTPYLIRYEPFIPSISMIHEHSSIYQEEVQLSKTCKVLLTLKKGCYYNLSDPKESTINLQLSIVNSVQKEEIDITNKDSGPLSPLHLKRSSHCDNNNCNIPSHIEAYIKREMDITYASYHKSHIMVMTHTNESSFYIGQLNGHRTYYINVPIPTELRKENQATLLKNVNLLDMTTTVDFSKYVKIKYKLCITAKIRYGLIPVRRQLFCVPIRFGTMTPGEPLPPTIVDYRDPSVATDITLSTKPKFLRPTKIEEQLPAYNDEFSPPIYDSL